MQYENRILVEGGCEHDGKVYSQGQEWSAGNCSKCFCQGGLVDCSPDPSCVRLVLWGDFDIHQNKILLLPADTSRGKNGGRTLVLKDSLSKSREDSISKNGLFILQLDFEKSVDEESSLCRLFR